MELIINVNLPATSLFMHASHLDVDVVDISRRCFDDGVVLCSSHQFDVVAEVPTAVAIPHGGNFVLLILIQEWVLILELVTPLLVLNDYIR